MCCYYDNSLSNLSKICPRIQNIFVATFIRCCIGGDTGICSVLTIYRFHVTHIFIFKSRRWNGILKKIREIPTGSAILFFSSFVTMQLKILFNIMAWTHNNILWQDQKSTNMHCKKSRNSPLRRNLTMLVQGLASIYQIYIVN